MHLGARVADTATLDVDAIVNAANEALLAGGVCAAPFIAPRARN